MLRPRRRSGELLAYPGLLLLLLSTAAVTFAAVSPTRTGLLAGRSGGRAVFAAVAAAVALGGGGGGGGGSFEALALSSPTTTARSVAQPAPPAAVNDIMRERFAALRSAVTGEKVSELRVGDTLVERLRAVDGLLDGLESDIYRDTIDWDVVSVYPKIFRAYSPLFTAYTDRAFPENSEIESALRYALRYEVGGFYSGVQDFERAVERRAPRQAQRAFARMSISYDHYLKAGDLYTVYEDNFDVSPSYSNPKQLNYIAPSIEAPGLEDEVVLLKGPDKGRKGVVLWIFKDETLSNNIIVKLEKMGESGHSEVRQYPYSLVAKTTPPEVQFFDDLFAAYLASAISCGIMYPIDTYKTRVQIGKKGLPGKEEGGPLGLYRGVGWFVADPNDAIYVSSYGIIKTALLAPVDVTNPLAVFGVLTLAGAIGDALGSSFRTPLELTWKKLQTGESDDGLKTLLGFFQQGQIQTLLIAWAAVLCRDVPFAGLQIALFDVYKNLFSSLDDVGVSLFLQRALWGAFAGGTAAVLTTPFDNLTTNLMTASSSSSSPSPSSTQGQGPGQGQEQGQEQGLTARLGVAWRDLLQGGLGTMYTGALPRVLFFSPAAMIFFACYETLTEIILSLNSGDLKIRLLEQFV